MTDDPKLPSARQILASDTAAREQREAGDGAGKPTDDDSFRRVMTALRAVLQMRGS